VRQTSLVSYVSIGLSERLTMVTDQYVREVLSVDESEYRGTNFTKVLFSSVSAIQEFSSKVSRQQQIHVYQ